MSKCIIGMFWAYRKATEMRMLRASHSVMDALPYSLKYEQSYWAFLIAYVMQTDLTLI